MGLMQEGLRRPGEIRNTLPPVNPNPSEIKVSKLPPRSDGSESRIPELLSLILGEKDKAEHAEEPKLKRENGFEPFVNPESSENTLFVNGYNGNFAQKMELNRKGIERVLTIAHLDGKVILTSFVASRKPSSEAQGNELAAKRNLLFVEKPQDDNKDNSIHRVVSVPQGWRIEINDQKLTEELTEKKIGGKQLQRAFINRFNRQLKRALQECVWREKCSSEKDEHFKSKALWSLLPIPLQAPLTLLSSTYHPLIITSLGVWNIIGYYLITHLLGKLQGFSSHYARQNFDSFWEYFMPHVEIDKVARTWTFLSLKARKLVREADSETKWRFGRFGDGPGKG